MNLEHLCTTISKKIHKITHFLIFVTKKLKMSWGFYCFVGIGLLEQW